MSAAAKPSVVFVLGGPGAGKGTQCARIVQASERACVCVCVRVTPTPAHLRSVRFLVVLDWCAGRMCVFGGGGGGGGIRCP